MKNACLLVVLAFIAICTMSCGNNGNIKAVPVFEEYTDDSFNDESDIVAIPFIVQDGVKLVDVEINDAIKVKMIVDTGCSGALISLSEARYLAEIGSLTADDILGEGQSMVADGRIVVNAMVRLKKLTIGGQLKALDVTATVSDNISAPLLLGNEVLDRVKSIVIDNEENQILFVY